MNKKYILQCLVVMLSAFSMQSYAVKPFTVTCGDGEKIEVADSAYNPAAIASACLTAGHQPPLPSQGTPQRNATLSVKKADAPYKTFKTDYLKTLVAKDSGRNAADVDHSDIILMLQGCHCISPSCVAYSCPADVDKP
ncbi:MAG TPA: hypothetical protein VFY78_08990 [Gammaproteobacteria bacterium]|nr:hypothetical protein [Gammaproteobacteria bacterium]